MPGINVKNRPRDQKAAEASEYKTYYLTDPHCTSIHGLDVTDEMRKNGLRLNGPEAMALLASGAVTSDKAQAQAASEEAAGRVQALGEAREAEAKARAEQSQAAAEAAAHNLGMKLEAPAADERAQGKPPAPGDGSLSSAEVDSHMASPPPAEPAQQSAAAPGAWAEPQRAG